VGESSLKNLSAVFFVVLLSSLFGVPGACEAQSSTAAIRVNSGGGSYVDSLGQTWSADNSFTGGSGFGTTASIANTTTAPLYQDVRYGNFGYSFAVPNGSYAITLKFAEIYYGASGERTFNVIINGSQVLTNFDVYAAAGGKDIAYDQTFPATVTNGAIQIQFVSVIDNATVNAIQIVPSSGRVTTSVSVSVNPPSTTLTVNQTQTFSASVTGSSNTAVSWTLSPPVGSIVGGVYTAPSSITSQQTVSVTATSQAAPTQSATSTITLTPATISVAPTQVTLTASQTAPFAATLTGLGSGVTWQINPQVGSITSSGLYTAPGSISAGQSVTVTAVSTSNSTLVATATIVLAAAGPPLVTLPVEVVGPAGTTKTATVYIASPVSGTLLSMQIHNLKYETEASVKINNGAWMPINTSTVTLLGHGATYGGIGGGFATLSMTLSVPNGLLESGSNTVTFMFNRTDGVTSGYRVLNFNFVGPDGTQLVSASSFAQDDPNSWQPPSSLSSDIAAGQSLWKTANLLTGSGNPMQATCSMCHAQDGRDLKYFNYSNQSIEARATFHGLSATQAMQIASYIRSLNVPNPGRPWNPPYQPGPGLDSLPVSQWAAGAGLDAVLDQDADMIPYLMPGGSAANWGPNGYLNAREMPISLQLPDWNHWLPRVHPLDAWGAAFTNSSLNVEYLNIRNNLVPYNSTTYQSVLTDIDYWLSRMNSFQTGTMNVLQPASSPSWTDPTYLENVYSVSLWNMVKLWEINEEFGLEGMSQVAFGPQAAARSWRTNMAFATSPFMSRIPRPSSIIGNGSETAHIYFSFVWYHVQLVLNDGNGTAQGTNPIDWGYTLGYPENDLTWDSTNARPRVGTAGLLMEWLIKASQSGFVAGGVNNTNPYGMVVFPAQVSTWSDISTPLKLQLMNAWVRTFLGNFQLHTAQQIFATGAASSTITFNPESLDGDLAMALPQLRYQGVDSGLLNQLATWASSIWPTYNWLNALNAPCTVGNLGAITCTVPTN
jgi:hypothetical protein